MAPQNQTIKIGKSFVLECDADGNPIPSITWQFNGAAVVVSQHLTLENENTELIVNNAQESDSGLYTCIAENESGRTTIAATVTVERMLGVPRIFIEPFNLEAFTGTTIELPCKAAEPSGIKLTWRKDGRIIDPIILSSEKYEISSTGSLFVKNVTIFDGGRYECSLKNEFGRATASALITISLHKLLTELKTKLKNDKKQQKQHLKIMKSKN
uniref:Ig-like domain-containing protein n=1 Tax=Glossina pallidipes TaxID=7398 RepID=A0A1B0AI49_GLOPL